MAKTKKQPKVRRSKTRAPKKSAVKRKPAKKRTWSPVGTIVVLVILLAIVWSFTNGASVNGYLEDLGQPGYVLGDTEQKSATNLQEIAITATVIGYHFEEWALQLGKVAFDALQTAASEWPENIEFIFKNGAVGIYEGQKALYTNAWMGINLAGRDFYALAFAPMEGTTQGLVAGVSSYFNSENGAHRNDNAEKDAGKDEIKQTNPAAKAPLDHGLQIIAMETKNRFDEFHYRSPRAELQPSIFDGIETSLKPKAVLLTLE
ncbi:MAG: hypothetical protein A3J48_02725 [Candidatus Doudnabacteria bacterium RIFCSPHIGHO2_02_FULL_46_11]|uniref:Uncharacterized protein n=1 Tax=Candidatus Doudnabacteria bacterium RIFCSPHIGHO2_02_FULL_46_11 TaxID=1817832 RepID=A0A1F5P8Y9_9BACT|nr:MAG: hypothetical protein A3J48_02725 [Candidatus Doudnabacteria bacterium RIFCSPHIGHO2_02_FULL_46_11]